MSFNKWPNSVRKVALSQQAVNLLVQEHEQHPDKYHGFSAPVQSCIQRE